MLPVDIARYLTLYPQCCHLGEEMILTDFSAFDLPSEVRHTTCIVLALCTGGKASYSVMGVNREVNANDVIILGEGQVVGDICRSEDFSGIVLFVSRSLLEGVIGDLRKVSNMFVFAHENPVLQVSEKTVATLLRYSEMLRSTVEDTSHAYKREVVATLLAGVVYEIANVSSKKLQKEVAYKTRSDITFRQFITLVEGHFRIIRRVGWYSEQMGLTPKTLLDIVKRVSNRTPNEWLDIYTVNELRHLLRHTDMSVKEISDSLNFSNQGAMGKFFKENVGLSPSQYRIK